MEMENSSGNENMGNSSSSKNIMDMIDTDPGEGKDQDQENSTHTINPNVNVVRGSEIGSEFHVSAPAPPVPKPSKCLLPPMEDANKKTLVLDLDGTLIRSSQVEYLGHDFTITFPWIAARGGGPSFYVSKRPGAEDLLQQLGGLYEIVVFTASGKQYANAIVDELLAGFDPEHRVIPATHRLYNEHCIKPEGTQVAIKDLSLLGRDLKNVIFVDDFPPSYFLQPRNAIPVSRWDPFVPDDNALYKVLGFCKQIADSPADVRELIAEYKCGRYD